LGECYAPLLHLGGKILTAQKLLPVLRELAILRVARVSGSEYEWEHHKAHALRDGVTEEQIETLDAGRVTGASFDETETAVLSFADQLRLNVRPSDEALAAVRESLSDQEVVELTLTVGFYMLMAQLMETTGVDVDAALGRDVIDALTQD
jgi:AhpD family alkylhydroperoxidase